VISQQSVRQAARRSALDARAVLRKEWADRERRLEALAVEVLTALGERDAFVWDAERRAGHALRTMTDEKGFAPRDCQHLEAPQRPQSRAGRSTRAPRIGATCLGYATLTGLVWTIGIRGGDLITT
jgi:hypothetical protein